MLNLRAQYDDLADIIRMMAVFCEESTVLLHDLTAKANDLEGGEWRGKGASAFYDEMQTDILPAFSRLVRAFELGHVVLQESYSLIEDAENEAARLFTGADLIGWIGSPVIASILSAAPPAASSVQRPLTGVAAGATAARNLVNGGNLSPSPGAVTQGSGLPTYPTPPPTSK